MRCVEMPLDAARMVYRLTRMGTVVTVTAGESVMSGLSQPAGPAMVQEGPRA